MSLEYVVPIMCIVVATQMTKDVTLQESLNNLVQMEQD
jgi:hypothetical protein